MLTFILIVGIIVYLCIGAAIATDMSWYWIDDWWGFYFVMVAWFPIMIIAFVIGGIMTLFE
jgi:hypothetical protein